MKKWVKTKQQKRAGVCEAELRINLFDNLLQICSLANVHSSVCAQRDLSPESHWRTKGNWKLTFITFLSSDDDVQEIFSLSLFGEKI